MSRKRKCCCNSHDHCSRHDRNGGCTGMDACTVLPTLLVLQCSGLLCNDRAYILILLSLLCGGFNACGCNNRCC
ncbi:TPA: hypothetical protein ACY4SV_000603 [Clostridium perfringens]|nr:hypothetical protein [Clostridium perfringens]HAT4113212.1 hypothetical protein [Clostridium perfringens]HAT4312969.1 hypothetical protein [Clostridium perfringens]